MNFKKLWSLQMFAEETEAAAAADTAATAESPAETPAVETEATAKASFDDLLKDADYKREYDSRVNRAVMGRMKKATAEREKLNPMFEMLAKKYGVDATDPENIDLDALNSAVMNDDALFEQEADERGMSVEGLRQLKNAERQLAASKKAREEEENQRRFQALLDEEASVKSLYPDFSLGAELENEQFGNLLASLQRSGFANPLRTAYEATHRDDVLKSAMSFAAKQTKEEVSQSIQSNASRPVEGAKGSAVNTSIDPSKLSLKDIEDIQKRVARGEKIYM